MSRDYFRSCCWRGIPLVRLRRQDGAFRLTPEDPKEERQVRKLMSVVLCLIRGGFEVDLNFGALCSNRRSELQD